MPRISAPADVRLTLAPHRRGGGDPAFRITPDGAVWRASWTPDGPGTLRIGAGGAQAWGPGAGWLLDGVPELLGEHDDPAALRPVHEVVRTAAERFPGLRIGRTRRVFEALVPAVLEQKVVGLEAWRAWRYLLLTFGEPAPGAPEGMRVPPPPEVWARIPSWEWHRSGAEAVRARTIMNAARVASRLEADAVSCLSGVRSPAGPEPATCHGDKFNPSESKTTSGFDRRLRSLPGIGVWTSAEIRQRALGDPDALSVGDYHLSGQVGYALTGEKTDDAGMIELLRPYAGQRHRVSMLLVLSGVRVPRRGPRMSVRDYRAF